MIRIGSRDATLREMPTGRSTPLAIFFLLLFSYAYINQGWGWNQNSRLALLHAIVVKHTVAIDAYEANTGDKEKLNGHWYSEKAPGMILIAAPAFLLSYGALKLARIDIDGTYGWNISERITTAGSVGVLAAVGSMCLFLFLRRRLDPRIALFATLAVFLGSLPFPYATMMFSHGATIGLIAASLWIFDAAERAGRAAWKHEYLLGFLCGLAVSSEYPAAIAAGIFFLLTLLRGWRSAARFVAGSFFPLLTIPAYNWAVSGFPLALGYSRVDFPGMQDGFFGVTLPNAEAFNSLLFSQFKGLFFWSPFLLLSAVGYPVIYRRSPRLFWITFMTPLAYALFASSYAYWDGGFAFGPRHLSAAVPFIAVAAGFGFARLPLAGGALALASVALTGIATFVNAMPPNEFHQPLFDFYPREFFDGKMAWNVGRAFGLAGAWSVAPWAAVVVAAAAVMFHRLGKKRTCSAECVRKRPPRHLWHLPSFKCVRGAGCLRRISRTLFSTSLWITAIRRAGVVRMLLWAAVAGGIILRFVHLNMMEFKGDELDVLIRAWRNAHGVEFAITSIPSSVGLMNPPFFVWMLSIPAMFTSDPVLVTAFVAAVNVAGLLLLYTFLRRAFSSDAALWTTALLATAPWAIIYSRKLWPQDVMIFFVALLYFALFAMMKKYRPWHVYLLSFALAAVTQLHLVAWIMPVILLVFFDIFRVPLRIRDVCGGLMVFAVLYLPYFLYQESLSFSNLLDFLRSSGDSLDAGAILEHFEWSVAATSGLKFAKHIGDETYALFARQYFGSVFAWFFLIYAFGVVISLVALARSAIRDMSCLRRLADIEPGHRILLLLLTVYAAIIGVYVFTGAPPYTQYHIIFYPLAPLVLVLGLQRALASRFLPPVFVNILLLLIVFSNISFSAGFLRFLALNPEKIGGGYGVPYELNRSKWERAIETATQAPGQSP